MAMFVWIFSIEAIQPKLKRWLILSVEFYFCCHSAAFLFFVSWDYVVASWAIRETSAENNGLPFIYLLKTLMLMMPGLLFLQGLAETIKNGLMLYSGESVFQDDADSEGPVL
jgi:TRAP-type mannitol/chloroaromatic compound transport system permease small subunit